MAHEKLSRPNQRLRKESGSTRLQNTKSLPPSKIYKVTNHHNKFSQEFNSTSVYNACYKKYPMTKVDTYKAFVYLDISLEVCHEKCLLVEDMRCVGVEYIFQEARCEITTASPHDQEPILRVKLAKFSDFYLLR